MKRPKGWEERYLKAYKREYSGSVKYGSPERAMFEAGADAMVGEIALKLQEIYNIPDLKTEDVRMGEFIQELLEEVK